MGSHGAATAEGQADVLAHYGIHEATMGVPVVSSLEVVSLGKTPEGIEVFLDKNGYESDGIFLVPRVKWHTDFRRQGRERFVQDDGDRAGQVRRRTTVPYVRLSDWLREDDPFGGGEDLCSKQGSWRAWRFRKARITKRRGWWRSVPRRDWTAMIAQEEGLLARSEVLDGEAACT